MKRKLNPYPSSTLQPRLLLPELSIPRFLCLAAEHEVRILLFATQLLWCELRHIIDLVMSLVNSSLSLRLDRYRGLLICNSQESKKIEAHQATSLRFLSSSQAF